MADNRKRGEHVPRYLKTTDKSTHPTCQISLPKRAEAESDQASEPAILQVWPAIPWEIPDTFFLQNL